MLNLDFNELVWLTNPLILSIKTIFISLFLLVIFGGFLAYFLAFYRGKFKSIIESIVMFPLIFPPIATGFLLLYIFGKNGLGDYMGFEIVFSFKALVIAAFLAGLPLFVRPVQAALENFPPNLIESAMILSKNRLDIALFVIFPNIAKTITSALILALGRGLGEVGITLMLGGNIVGKTDTISLAIYNAVYDGETQKALILSLILVFVSIVIFWFINKLKHR